MPLHSFPEIELRKFCKEYIESLELWLRRLIDKKLSDQYGENYFKSTDENGNNIISNKIRKEIEIRISSEPERYPRPIDACLLESEIQIITNPVLYAQFFREIFIEGYPEGRDELSTFLSRLIIPRNKLYHANPLSVREAEQVICYTNDIVDCIKTYYIKNNMNEDFNVPLIIKYSDSFGNTFYRNQFQGQTMVGGEYIDFSKVKEYYLRPGERITMEVEVDPTFPKDDYKIIWSPENTLKIENSTHYSYTIQNKDVGQIFNISAKILTNKEWHRLNGFDDYLVIKLKVLPPL